MWDYYTPVEPMDPRYFQVKMEENHALCPPLSRLRLQNITTVRLPFLLLDALGLGFAAWPEFWVNHLNSAEVMFVNQPVGDALWGAHDQVFQDLLEALQLYLDLKHINITIPVNKFDAAPGEYGCG
jgi:hypothetical protein